MFSEAATDCTLAAVCNKIEGGYRHNDQPDDEVRHGEAHDEHVGDGLEPLLSPGSRLVHSRFEISQRQLSLMPYRHSSRNQKLPILGAFLAFRCVFMT